MKNRDIIEGLKRARLQEKYDSMEDTAVCVSTASKLSDYIKKVIENRYKGVEYEGIKFNNIVDFYDVDIFVRDEEDTMLDDVISELSLFVVLKDKKDTGIVQKYLKTDKYLKDWKIDDETIYLSTEDKEEIIDYLDSITRIDSGVKKMYKVVTLSEIENNIERQMKEWKEEKKEMEREYWRSR